MSLIAPNEPTDDYRVHDKLSKLKKRNYIIGDPEDFVHIDWLAEWSEMQNLQPLSDGRGSE